MMGEDHFYFRLKKWFLSYGTIEIEALICPSSALLFMNGF